MAHVIYDNFIISNKVANFLDTKLEHSPFYTLDTSLTQEAGMTKTVNVYTATGNVRDVAAGEGNLDADGVAVSFTPVDYVVKYTQGFLAYTDEDEMKDPNVVSVGTEKMAGNMANDLTTKLYAELAKTTQTDTYPLAGLDYATITDAISVFGEDETGLFMLINPAQKAQLRKSLKDDLKYSEGFSRTGYIGSVNNVPVYTSSAVPVDTCYIATKEAVTVFVKKDVETEQVRDANIRTNKIYTRRCNIVALTDATKALKLTKALS